MNGVLNTLFGNAEPGPQRLARSFGVGGKARARAIARALRTDTHLVFESPIGAGRTIPWLAPVVADALEGSGQVLVVTATEARQKELLDYQLPLLQRYWPELAVIRWRPTREYLCLEQLDRVRRRAAQERKQKIDPEEDLSRAAPGQSVPLDTYQDDKALDEGSRQKEVHGGSVPVQGSHGPLHQASTPPDQAETKLPGAQNRRKGRRASRASSPPAQARLPALARLSAAELEALERQVDWSEQTDSGRFDDFPEQLSRSLRQQCCVEADDCLRDRCPFAAACFERKAWPKDGHPTVIVCDYPTLFQNLAIRSSTKQRRSAWDLPPHLVVVLDEAHAAAQLAREALGQCISLETVRGLLAPLVEDGALEEAGRLQKEAASFFDQLTRYLHTSGYRVRLEETCPAPPGALLEALEDAAYALARVWYDCPDLERRRHQRRRALDLSGRLEALMNLTDTRQVVTLEHDRSGNAAIRSQPVEVAGFVGQLFARARCVLVTSDTLTVCGRFETIRAELGIPELARVLESMPARSPASRLLMVVPERLPDPTERDWPIAVTCRFMDIQNATDGRACAHFTSEEVVEHVQNHIRYLGARIWRDTLDGPALIDLIPPDGEVAQPRKAASNTAGTMVQPTEPASLTAGVAVRTTEPASLTAGVAVRTTESASLTAGVAARTTESASLSDGEVAPIHSSAVQSESDPSPAGEASVPAGRGHRHRALPAYTCLIIDRLPFPHSGDPLLDIIKERDPAWFVRFALPRAVLDFRQAITALMRPGLKRLAVVVLDRRILSRPYGRLFFECFPDLAVSRRLDDIPSFLKGKEVRT